MGGGYVGGVKIGCQIAVLAPFLSRSPKGQNICYFPPIQRKKIHRKTLSVHILNIWENADVVEGRMG